MGASTCCAEAEADTQFTIFDLSALKKQSFTSWQDGFTHQLSHMSGAAGLNSGQFNQKKTTFL
jgi:hypothetical protein